MPNTTPNLTTLRRGFMFQESGSKNVLFYANGTGGEIGQLVGTVRHIQKAGPGFETLVVNLTNGKPLRCYRYASPTNSYAICIA